MSIPPPRPPALAHATAILCSLSSDDLHVRKAASRGLVSLDPGWVIPRLCQRLAVLLPAGEDVDDGDEEEEEGREEDSDSDEKRRREALQLEERLNPGKAVPDAVGGAGWRSRGR